jgi:HlyD family secretion protein
VVDSPPDYLRPDMTVSVTIRAGERGDAVVVPLELVRDPAGAAPYVLLSRDGRQGRRPVRLGLRIASAVEILDGVTAGELIVPPPASPRGRTNVHPSD